MCHTRSMSKCWMKESDSDRSVGVCKRGGLGLAILKASEVCRVL